MKLQMLGMVPLAAAMSLAGCAGGNGRSTAPVPVDLRTARVVCCDTNSPACRLAAEELDYHLKLVVGERRPAPNGFVFAIGEKPTDEPAPGVWDSKGRAVGNKILFWGDESPCGKTKTEILMSQGPLFAVYEFLSDKLGVRWMCPGADGIVAPPCRTLTVSEGESWNYRPKFEVCSFPVYRNMKRYKKVEMPKCFRLSKNQFNARQDDLAIWYRRRRLASLHQEVSGHAFGDWQARFLKDHPDWFAYVEHPDLARDGKLGRGVKDGTASRVHGCYANPELAQAIVDDWVAQGMPKRLNLCLNDGKYCFCHCPACLALDTRTPDEDFFDHLTDRVVHLYNGVSTRAVAKRPDVDIVAYIYSTYRKPPRREKLINGDHFTFSYVPHFEDDILAQIKAWSAAGVKKFYYRPNFMCYSSVFPRGIEKWLYDNFREMLNYGSVGYSYDGGPSGAMQLEYYVLTELCQHPTRDFDSIVREFYAQYGAAAPEAQAYFERLRARSGRFFDSFRNAADAKARLDDSEIAKFAVKGHTKADLEADLAVLAPGREKQLAPADAKRFKRLCIRAEHALLTFDFFMTGAGKDEAAFQTAAKRLDAFRRANLPLLGNDAGAWYGNLSGEAALWKRTDLMK